MLDILDENLLGQLYLQHGRVHLLGQQRVPDMGHQGLIVQLPARQVDGNPEVFTGRAFPARQLAAGGQDHPAADLGNAAAFLRQGNELTGCQQAPARVLPANQCLDAGYLVGVQIELGLVVQNEFVIGQGLAQILVQFQPHHLPVLHAFHIELIGVAALLLGPVQGNVGVAQQGVGIQAALGIQGHAHGGGNAVALALNLERLLEALADLPEQMNDIIDIVDLLLAHHKLVTAGIGHQHQLVAEAVQPFRHANQQLVAKLVAESIVEHLEAVKVEQNQRCLAHLPVGNAEGMGQVFHKEAAVGQADESVGGFQPFQVCLHGFTLVDLPLQVFSGFQQGLVAPQDGLDQHRGQAGEQPEQEQAAEDNPDVTAVFLDQPAAQPEADGQEYHQN